MAITTYPLNDIEYTAEDAELYNCTRNSGVYSGSDFTCTVNGTNNNVVIGEGVGWIRNGRFAGKVFANREAETIALDVADAVYPRIDVVGVRYETATNRTDIVVKKGTASANPVMPDIVQTETVYELYFYSVYREAAATVITADNVTDLRLDANYCGLMGDAITSIDTSAINEQFSALLAKIKKELADLKIGKIDAYSREETLSPTTKTLLGLSEDAVPDDAFKAVAMPFKVGDILHTMRTDLDDKWLLCNGDIVSEEEYPDISSLKLAAGNIFLPNPTAAGLMPYDTTYGDGIWAVGGKAPNSGVNSPAIAYTTTPIGEWTTVQIAGVDGYINRLKHINGKWIAVGAYKNGSSYYPCIWHSEDITSGEWTRVNINGNGATGAAMNITFMKGLYIVGGYQYSSGNIAAIWHSTDLVSFSHYNLGIYAYDATATALFSAMGATDDYFVGAVKESTNQTTLVYSTDGRSYAKKIIYQSGTFTPTSLVYLDKWYVLFASDTQLDLYAFDAADGEIQISTIYRNQAKATKIAKGKNGALCFGWDAQEDAYFLLESDASVTNWRKTILGDNNDLGQPATQSGVAVSDDNWCAVCKANGTTEVAAFTDMVKALPVIATNGCYTYIKAKE